MLNKGSARSTPDKDTERERRVEEEEEEADRESLENAALVFAGRHTEEKRPKENVQEIMQKNNNRFRHEWRYVRHVCLGVFFHVGLEAKPSFMEQVCATFAYKCN